MQAQAEMDAGALAPGQRGGSLEFFLIAAAVLNANMSEKYSTLSAGVHALTSGAPDKRLV